MKQKVLVIFDEDKDEIVVMHNTKNRSMMYAMLARAFGYVLEDKAKKEIPVTIVRKDNIDV